MVLKNSENLMQPIEKGGLGIDKIKQIFGKDINDLSDFKDEIKNLNGSFYKQIKVE